IDRAWSDPRAGRVAGPSPTRRLCLVVSENDGDRVAFRRLPDLVVHRLRLRDPDDLTDDRGALLAVRRVEHDHTHREWGRRVAHRSDLVLRLLQLTCRGGGEAWRRRAVEHGDLGLPGR